MSMSEKLKGLIFKKPARPADPRRSDEPLEGGRRSGETENPYLAARRTWNDHVGGVVASRQTWQIMGILSLMIVLASVGGLITIGMQSKFIPYVVEVDKLGQQQSVGPAQQSKTDIRNIRAAAQSFVIDLRTVTPDVAMQRRAVFRAYALLSANDPATAKANEWLNGTADSSPFKRATKEMVNVEVTSVLQQSPDTWQVDWTETTRDRQGVLKDKDGPVRMRALVTMYTVEINNETPEEQFAKNPFGIYVRDFSWSKLL
jgi:type IV secretory pathway TrbF-like protein